MDKEFKTIDELICLLESRNVTTDENTAAAISRESYYAVVNGYKKPFLDYEAMEASGSDVFKPGVEFRWMYDLFMFDRDLRIITFNYLTRAEAVVKTSVVYSFCRSHREESSYLDVSNFCTGEDILVPKAFKGNKKALYSQNISRLMTTLNGKLVVKSKTRPFIKHYMSKHGYVPLWVLANDLTFGNVAHFYQLMQSKDQADVCRSIAKVRQLDSKKDGTLSPRELLRATSILVDFRNICAHDERLYCAKSGNDDFAVMLSMMLRVLPKIEVEDIVQEIFDLFDKYKGKLNHVTPSTLLDDMGFHLRRDERTK